MIDTAYYVTGYNEDDERHEVLLATNSELIAHEIAEAMSQRYEHAWFDVTTIRPHINVTTSRPYINCTVDEWRDYIEELVHIPWKN